MSNSAKDANSGFEPDEENVLVLPKVLTDEVVRDKVRQSIVLELTKYGVEAYLDERLESEIQNAQIVVISDDYKVLIKSITGVSTAMTSAWVVSRYEAVKMEDSILTHAFRDLPPAESDEDKQKLIDRYVLLLQKNGQAISYQQKIESLDDIEGYEKNRLDPDLEATVTQPYRIDDRIWVFYTYNRIGGVVTRYRFEFDVAGKLRSVQVQIIGREIGAYGYLQ